MTISSISNPEFILLESDIMYDWDDYGVYGAVLYDIANKSITTTKYGHDVCMDETGVISLNDAIDQNVISIDELIKNLLNNAGLAYHLPEAIEYICASHSIENPVAIPVNVTRGRKFKGEGYIIYGIWEYVRYGLGAYHNEKNYYPMIFDPKTNTMTKVNSYGYCKYSDEFINTCLDNIYNNIPHTIQQALSIAHIWAYNMSYSSCDRQNCTNAKLKLCYKAFNNIEIPSIVKEFCNNTIKAENAKREAKMNEELPNIIEWVKTNTDKTEDQDIIDLAKHIWYKHNKK